MENIEYKITEKRIGLTDLENLLKDLLKIDAHNNHPFSTQILNNLILKVDIIIRKLKYNPRLPLIEIEKEIVNICKLDTSTHGVIIKILFSTKFGKIDTSRLSYVTVNV
ncbi:hypothetical protein [Thalassobellus suaedae]|uniref:Uncharacterized protein n=1 Tax=Thalassobellus suaedae TaxID=3074124 RepID=A0ABY9XPD6_9FLAO|nr:hypothetical protein RHP51_10640 [Flavobacteriaceae bacterium HL-DH14]